jgi:hypothetical protein
MIRMTTTAIDTNKATVAASDGVSLDFAQNLVELIDPDTPASNQPKESLRTENQTVSGNAGHASTDL